MILHADGAIQTQSTSTTGGSIADAALVIDGSIPADGGYRRLIIRNTAFATTVWENFSMDLVVTGLAAGNHTFGIAGAWVSGSPVNIMAGSGSVLEGTLTVTIIKL